MKTTERFEKAVISNLATEMVNMKKTFDNYDEEVRKNEDRDWETFLLFSYTLY